MLQPVFIWAICCVAIVCIIVRPLRIPEAVWAVAAAFLLTIFRLIPMPAALGGVAKGADVYLFLLGMMLLAEVAREEKLFDWLAVQAAIHSGGSPKKLFFLVYVVGVFVTAFLSNDATAVVLTPAVAAVMRAARVKTPLPYLLICAFIANAASFILPISNPANLVIYGSHVPSLAQWVSRYGLPSVAAVLVTYTALYLTQRRQLAEPIGMTAVVPLGRTGKVAAYGIAATAIVLLVSSAFNLQLGLPTAVTGVVTSGIVLLVARKSPATIIKGVSWSVLPLVAGLFVIVEALNRTGLITKLAGILNSGSADSRAWVGGLGIALLSNVMNNLPAGLIAADTLQSTHVPEIVRSAILIGVDLGPNLSVTGSLATILWLTALKREGQTVSAWTFLKLGVLIMIPALLAALGALWLR